MTPGRVLREPITDRLVDVELAVRFQLQNDRRLKMLGVAADLKERVAVDRRVVAQPIAPRPGFDGRAGVAGIDVEKDGGNAFDVVAPRKIIVERPLDRRDDVGVGGKNAAGRESVAEANRRASARSVCTSSSPCKAIDPSGRPSSTNPRQ